MASPEQQGSPNWHGVGWSGLEGFSGWSEYLGSLHDSAHEWQGASTGEHLADPADMWPSHALNPNATFDIGTASSHPQTLQERAHSRTSQPVTEAIEALRQIKARFAALLDGNWTPGEEEKIFDAVVIPTLIAAESARKPSSPLTLLDTSKELGQWLRKSIPTSGKRAVAVLPGYEEHAVAMDVRIIGGRSSVLIIDPLGTDPDRVAQYRKDVFPALKERLPSNAKTTLSAINTRGETIGDRYSRHASERHPWPFVILEMDQRGLRGTVDPKVIEPRRLSTSLEQKRLVYVQRALDFLQVASEDESRQFVKRLERFSLKETDISTPNLRSQPWGPDPYTL
ncbi:YopJ family acetyltransferase [Xanthomonas arboricola]|uniref:YopJ family acetyltransferase n=1 Tax=Xanthomonas arboricola TaxID=56448 RepID=UPI003CCFA303